MMRENNSSKDEFLPLNLRVERRTLQLIDRAVAEVGGDRTSFIVDAACRRAEEVILDRCLFRAKADALAALDRVLESSTGGCEALDNLVRRERLWSKNR